MTEDEEFAMEALANGRVSAHHKEPCAIAELHDALLTIANGWECLGLEKRAPRSQQHPAQAMYEENQRLLDASPTLSSKTSSALCSRDSSKSSRSGSASSATSCPSLPPTHPTQSFQLPGCHCMPTMESQGSQGTMQKSPMQVPQHAEGLTARRATGSALASGLPPRPSAAVALGSQGSPACSRHSSQASVRTPDSCAAGPPAPGMVRQGGASSPQVDQSGDGSRQTPEAMLTSCCTSSSPVVRASSPGCQAGDQLSADMAPTGLPAWKVVLLDCQHAALQVRTRYPSPIRSLIPPLLPNASKQGAQGDDLQPQAAASSPPLPSHTASLVASAEWRQEQQQAGPGAQQQWHIQASAVGSKEPVPPSWPPSSEPCSASKYQDSWPPRSASTAGQHFLLPPVPPPPAPPPGMPQPLLPGPPLAARTRPLPPRPLAEGGQSGGRQGLLGGEVQQQGWQCGRGAAAEAGAAVQWQWGQEGQQQREPQLQQQQQVEREQWVHRQDTQYLSSPPSPPPPQELSANSPPMAAERCTAPGWPPRPPPPSLTKHAPCTQQEHTCLLSTSLPYHPSIIATPAPPAVLSENSQGGQLRRLRYSSPTPLPRDSASTCLLKPSSRQPSPQADRSLDFTENGLDWSFGEGGARDLTLRPPSPGRSLVRDRSPAALRATGAAEACLGFISPSLETFTSSAARFVSPVRASLPALACPPMPPSHLVASRDVALSSTGGARPPRPSASQPPLTNQQPYALRSRAHSRDSSPAHHMPPVTSRSRDSSPCRHAPPQVSSRGNSPTLGRTPGRDRKDQRTSSVHPSPRCTHEPDLETAADCGLPAIVVRTKALERELHQVAREVKEGPVWKPGGHSPGPDGHTHAGRRRTSAEGLAELPQLAFSQLYIDPGATFKLLPGA